MCCVIENVCICAAKTFVDKTLRQFKVVIFIKSKCAVCLSTAKLLASFVPHIIEFNEYREVDVDSSDEICSYLQQLTGKSTVRYEEARIYPDNLEVCQNHIVVERFKAVS